MFGLALGAGFATELASLALVPLAAWIAADGSATIGALVFASFSVARTVPILGEAVASRRRRLAVVPVSVVYGSVISLYR
jgi:hypothetical protein